MIFYLLGAAFTLIVITQLPIKPYLKVILVIALYVGGAEDRADRDYNTLMDMVKKAGPETTLYYNYRDPVRKEEIESDAKAHFRKYHYYGWMQGGENKP